MEIHTTNIAPIQPVANDPIDLRPKEKETIPVNPYYTDSLTSAAEQMPLISQQGKIHHSSLVTEKKPTLLKAKIELLSQNIDEQLAVDNINFEKLKEMVYKLIQALGKDQANSDQEIISKMNVEIKVMAVKIQNTYNNWKGVTITVISATISVIGGIGGLAPLLPKAVCGEDLARILSGASQSVGTAGTSLGGIASIFNSASEGERQVLQIHLKRKQDKEEDRKSAKHSHKEMTKDAAKAAENSDQLAHQTFSEMAK